MKVVAKTDEYTIYQKRSERYAVKDANKQYVNGEEKAAILQAQGLVKAPPKKQEEPEPAEDAASEDASASEESADTESE